MKSERKLPIFRICLSGLSARGSCWLLLGGGVIVAWLVPMQTPWEENLAVLQPARAQAAWVYAWIAMFTWLPYQGAALGHRLRIEGLLEHMRAGGQSAASLCLQITAAVAVWMVGLGLLATVVVVGFCSPSQPQEAILWLQVVLQYFTLYTLSAIPLLLLAVALGSRTSEVLAFLVPVGLLFGGVFGGRWLTPIFADSESPAFKVLWLILPHYHLADLTPRLVFKMGPLPTTPFLQIIACLGLGGLAFSIIGICLFRTRS
jgi:hypothetical protein